MAVEKAQSHDIFVEALTRARSKTNQLLKLEDVKKQVERAAQKPFLAHWKRRVDSGEVPPGVGTLIVKSGQASGRRVFLLSDVVSNPVVDGGVQPKAASSGKAPSKVLKERMLSEFDRLNAKSDGRYYVSLFDLRGALDDVSRSEFDAALNELRRDWILTLSPAEGRHEIVPSHILDAGVLEQSRLLVYVTRRES